MALPQDVCDVVHATAGYAGSARNLAQVSLATDTVFGDDGGASQLATVTGDATAGYVVTLDVRVDTGTTPSGGSVPGGPGGPDGPGDPGSRPGGQSDGRAAPPQA